MDQISEDLNSNWSERQKSDPDIQASLKNRSNLPIMNFKDEIMSNIHESPVVLIRGNTGKSLSEALLFAEHGENILCTKIVLNVRNNFCTQHVLPKFELGMFIY